MSPGSRLLAVALVATTNAFAAGTQCMPDERVVFSCPVAGAKVVSLCLAKRAAPERSSLAYRFGPLRKPELVFPESARDSLARFRYSHYMRPRTDRTELSFTNGAAVYTVYDHSDAKSLRGVRMTMGSTELDLPCREPTTSRLGELSDLVPCDAESALADCRSAGAR